MTFETLRVCMVQRTGNVDSRSLMGLVLWRCILLNEHGETMTWGAKQAPITMQYYLEALQSSERKGADF